MGKKDFFPPYEYIYDEYFDCVICPENHVLSYAATNREGCIEFKSKGYTPYRGSTQVTNRVRLKFAAMNLKKMQYTSGIKYTCILHLLAFLCFALLKNF